MNNKNKIIIIICESKSNCTEKQYFEYIQKTKRDILNYDLLYFTMGYKFEVNKFLSRINFINNSSKFLIVKDNDLHNDRFSQENYASNLKQTLEINKKTLKIKNIDNISILFHGIPTNNFSFDHFLLFHFKNQICHKNRKNPIAFLKKEIDTNYKGKYKNIEKIFTINIDWKNNLFLNSKKDDNYFQLVETIFKK